MKRNRNKILAIFMTVFTLIILIGITYTFFSASVSNTNNEKLTTQTATMSLEFDDNDNGVSANLNLNESIVKKFTLENTGTVDAYAKIKWYDLVNTYTPDSLSWTLEQGKIENGNYILVGSGKVPVSSSSSNKLLKGSLLVPANRTYYYKLTITLNDLEVNQSSDINASMHSKFSLSTESDTAVDTVQKLAMGNPINETDVIDTTEYEYETENGYVFSFNGFIVPTEYEYETNELESCEEMSEYFLNGLGPTVTGECRINPSTGKYNIDMNGQVTNPDNTNLIFENQNECEEAVVNSELENTTCVNAEVKISTDVPVSNCTNTLAYDGTTDNNLRYIGANPCNYVTFNGESPSLEKTVYKIIYNENSNDPGYDIGVIFETEEECTATANYQFPTEQEMIDCKLQKELHGGWRIIGVMNTIDDGTGNLETRIKLMRDLPLGYYSWDTSDSNINYGGGLNNWLQADLNNELNGDYLNTSLNENTTWYNGRNNQKTAIYDYTKGLRSSAQNLIENAKWSLGVIDLTNNNLTPHNLYTNERETKTNFASSWIGKVALIHLSDYGFATSGGQTTNRYSCTNSLSLAWGYVGWRNDTYMDCQLNDWIPSQWNLNTESSAFGAVNGYTFYGDDGYPLSQAYPVHPVVYLKSDVSFSGGSGTPDDPYILS